MTPPPGFVVDSQVSQVSLDIDSPDITTIHRVNHPTTWKILKADALTGKALEGAELEILDERGQSLMCQTTDSSGLVEITGLLPGRYTFREIRQPNGYLTSSPPSSALTAAVPRGFPASPDGNTIVYLSNDVSDFELELTWLKDHPQPYNLGECEFHLAFQAEDYEAAHKKHEEMGCICFENEAMGIYFIVDPDGYWLEILP